MCKFIEPFYTDTKFVILMHLKEFKKVKNNTGHFTHQTLTNSELFVGVDFTKNNRINEIIKDYDSYILFPSVNALDITKTNPKTSNKPLAIFVIDSTWACTKKMFTQSKNLQELRHISFTTQRVSKYEIKAQPQDNYLSTIESVLVVLENLNGLKIEDVCLKNFLKPFEEMILYQKNLIQNPKSNAVRFKRR